MSKEEPSQYLRTRNDWHTLEKSQVLQNLSASDAGLTEFEAERRLADHGHNEIKKIRRESAVPVLLKQFREPLIVILLAASAISSLVGEIVDSLVIISIVIMAVSVSFVQQFRSEKAIEELIKMTAATIHVLRSGEQKTVDVRELVPGDVILLNAGDVVPADSYLLEGFNMQTNEAVLTGESTPIQKESGAIRKESPLPERRNILYTLTTVTYGRGKAVVFATGMSTELGKIAKGVQRIEIQKTPFEARMKGISKILTIIMISVVGVISTFAFLRGFEIIEVLVWGLSLAVAAVPEALPAVITSSLMIAVYKMAKQNAVIRRLSAVETLGSTTVICSDKTGTLTKGEMTVRKVYIHNGYADVTGVGYDFDGSIDYSKASKQDLALLALTACACVMTLWCQRRARGSE